MLHSGRSTRRGNGCGCRVVSEGVWEGDGYQRYLYDNPGSICLSRPEPQSQFSCATRAVDVAWDNDCVKHEEGLSSSQVSLRSSSFAHQLCFISFSIVASFGVFWVISPAVPILDLSETGWGWRLTVILREYYQINRKVMLYRIRILLIYATFIEPYWINSSQCVASCAYCYKKLENKFKMY